MSYFMHRIHLRINVSYKSKILKTYDVSLSYISIHDHTQNNLNNVQIPLSQNNIL